MSMNLIFAGQVVLLTAAGLVLATCGAIVLSYPAVHDTFGQKSCIDSIRAKTLKEFKAEVIDIYIKRTGACGTEGIYQTRVGRAYMRLGKVRVSARHVPAEVKRREKIKLLKRHGGIAGVTPVVVYAVLLTVLTIPGLVVIVPKFVKYVRVGDKDDSMAHTLLLRGGPNDANNKFSSILSRRSRGRVAVVRRLLDCLMLVVSYLYTFSYAIVWGAVWTAGAWRQDLHFGDWTRTEMLVDVSEDVLRDWARAASSELSRCGATPWAPVTVGRRGVYVNVGKPHVLISGTGGISPQGFKESVLMYRCSRVRNLWSDAAVPLSILLSIYLRAAIDEATGLRSWATNPTGGDNVSEIVAISAAILVGVFGVITSLKPVDREVLNLPSGGRIERTPVSEDGRSSLHLSKKEILLGF